MLPAVLGNALGVVHVTQQALLSLDADLLELQQHFGAQGQTGPSSMPQPLREAIHDGMGEGEQ